MLASGTMLVFTRFTGKTTRALGATPKLHIIWAPMQTCIGMLNLLRSCHLTPSFQRGAN
jgi:hypothetical protein